MPAPVSHPTPDLLAAYGSGRLAPVDAHAVEEHLGGCEECGARLDEFFPDPFASALRRAASIESECSVHAPTVAFASEATATDLEAVPPELAAHPRYRLGELLGRGGMGAVYKAEHTLMERPVAVKVIAPQLLRHPGAVERFKQEVKAAAKLHHPNIVTAFDAEAVGSVVVLVMEFVEGRSLADVLAERGPLPVREACEYAFQAARGLAHAHALGMIHRDVKPHNLMLADDGCVKILDFGLARFVSEGLTDAGTEEAAPADAPTEGLTSTGAVMGTLDYMAPEQARDAHSADTRADVYALGCTLYHLLTGRVPFPGGTALEKFARLTSDEPPPLTGLRPDVPPKLAALVGKMMAKRPEERFNSATEVADALAALVRPVVPNPVPRRRWRVRAALASLAAFLVVGAAIAWSVVKVPTEQGEVVIETDDADVEVVVKGDRIVRIRDPKTGREYTLDRQNATLGETDGDGLQVTLDGNKPVILKRNGQKIASVRLASNAPDTHSSRPVIPKITPVSVISPTLTEFGHGAPIAAGLAVSPDGRLAVTSGAQEQEPGKPPRVWRVGTDCDLRLWDLATGKELGRLGGHRGHADTVAFSPDGKRVAAAVGGTFTDPNEYRIRVWDVETRKQVLALTGHTAGPPAGVAWSPDGTRIASAAWDKTIRIWDATTGQELARVGEGITTWGRVAFSPDGRSVFGAGWGTAAGWGRAGRFPLDGSKEFREFAIEGVNLGHVSGLAVSPDGEVVATGSMEAAQHSVLLWDARTGRRLGEVTTHLDWVMSVAFTPDGKSVVSTGWDRTVRSSRRDSNAGRRVIDLPSPGMSVAVTPDGKHALVGCLDRVVRIVDITEPPPPVELTPRLVLTAQKSPRSVAATPDGKFVYSSGYDKTVRAWNLDTGNETQRIADGTEPFDALALSPDGSRLLVTHHDRTVRLWDVRTGKELQALKGHTNTVACVAFSADGKLALTGGHDNTVRLWDLDTGKERKVLRGHTGPVRAVVFLPGNRAASGAHDGTVRVWNIDTAQAIKSFGPFSNYVLTLAALPDGKRLLTNGGDAAAVLDVESKLVARWFHGHTQNLHAVAVSPDGRLLATGGYDRTVRVWEIGTGRCVAIGRGSTEYVISIAFAGNHTLVAAGDNTIRVWELPGSPRAPNASTDRLFPFTGEVRFPLFHPDGRHLIIPDGNKITVWDTATGEKRKQFDGSTERIMCLRLTADRKTLVAVACGNRVIGWDWESGRKIDGFAAAPFQLPLALAVFPDGKRVAMRDEPGVVSVRGWPDGKVLNRIDLGNKDAAVWSLATSPDGRWLVVVCGCGQTWIWDAVETKVVATFSAVKDSYHVAACAFDPAGRWLAVGTSKGARVWAAGRWSAAPMAIPADAAGMVAFDAAGAVLVTAPIQTSGSAAFSRWNHRTGERLGTVDVPLTQEWVHAALGPDGRTVAVEVTARQGFVLFDSTALPVAPMPRAVTAKPIPAELDLIPRNAAGFVTVPVNELMTAPSLAWARQQVLTGGDLAGYVKATTRLDLHEVTRATVIWPTAEHLGGNILVVPPEVPSRVLVLTSSKSIRDRYAEYFKPVLRAQKDTEEYRGRRYLLDADGWTAIFLADDHTLVVGSRASVRLVIDRLADPKAGPLDDAVRTAADRPESVVLGFQGAKGAGRALTAQFPQVFDSLAPAFTADRVTLVASCRDGMRLEYRGEFATEDDAKRAEVSLGKACASGASALGEMLAEYDRGMIVDGRDAERKRERDFFVQTRDALKGAKPERTTATLRLALRTESTYGFAMILPAVPYVLMPYGPMATDEDGSEALARDRAIARALMAYHAKHGHFPPPAILGKDGKALLSWRVAILPHLGDDAAALYKEFKLDEPWDSPANKKLLDRMPAALSTSPFKSPYRPRPNSGYRVYVAKGSVFEGPGGRAKTEITDEPANTILAVRHREEVPWTKPDALSFDNLEVVPHAAVFADGTARPLSRDESPDALKAMVTRSGGEKVTPNEPGKRSGPARPPAQDR